MDPKLYTLTIVNDSKIESEVPTGPHNLRAGGEDVSGTEKLQVTENATLLPVMTVTKQEAAYTNSKSDLKLQKVSVVENISYENAPAFIAINPQYYEVQGSVPTGPHLFRDEIIKGDHRYMHTNNDTSKEKDQEEPVRNEKAEQRKPSKIPVKFRRSAEKVINDNRLNKERNRNRERNGTKKEHQSNSLIPKTTNILEPKSDVIGDGTVTSNEILTPDDPEKQFDKIYAECKDDNVYSLNDSIVQQAKEIDPNEIDNIFKEIVQEDGKKDFVPNKEKYEVKQSKIPVFRTKSGDQVRTPKSNPHDRRSSLRRESDVKLQKNDIKKQPFKSSIPQKTYSNLAERPTNKCTDQTLKQIVQEKAIDKSSEEITPVNEKIIKDVNENPQNLTTENEKAASDLELRLTNKEENKHLSEAPTESFAEKIEDKSVTNERIRSVENVEMEENVEEVVILQPEQNKSIYYTIFNEETDDSTNKQKQSNKSETEMEKIESFNIKAENDENIKNEDERRLYGKGLTFPDSMGENSNMRTNSECKLIQVTDTDNVEVFDTPDILLLKTDQEKVEDVPDDKKTIEAQDKLSENFNVIMKENNLVSTEEITSYEKNATVCVKPEAFVEFQIEDKNIATEIVNARNKDENNENVNVKKLRQSLECFENYNEQSTIIKPNELKNAKSEEVVEYNFDSNATEINETKANTGDSKEVINKEKINDLLPKIENINNKIEDIEVCKIEHIETLEPDETTFVEHKKIEEIGDITKDSILFESKENMNIKITKPNYVNTSSSEIESRENEAAASGIQVDEKEKLKKETTKYENPEDNNEIIYELQKENERISSITEHIFNENGDHSQKTHIEEKVRNLNDIGKQIDDFPENYTLKGRVSAITNAINANEVEQKTSRKFDVVIPKKTNILKKIAIFEQPQSDENRSLKSFKSFTTDRDKEELIMQKAKTAEPKLTQFEFQEVQPKINEVEIFKPKIIDEIVKKEIKVENKTTVVHEVDIKITEEVLEPKGFVENEINIDKSYLHTEPKTNLSKIKSVSEKILNDNIKGKVNTLIERMLSMDDIDHKPKETISIKEMPKKKTVSDRIAMFENMTATPQSQKLESRRYVDLARTKKQLKFSDFMNSEEVNCKIVELKKASTTYGRLEETATIILTNGHRMPVLALGTAMIHPDLVRHVVEAAIDLGYRAFDTACIYENERLVGEGINAKIASGVVKREDLFIINKLWSTCHRSDLVEKACRDSLRNLNLDYFDLYLIHNPMSFKEGGAPFPKIANVLLYSEHDYLEAWLAMEQLLPIGLARSIGVSNFNSEQITRILDKGRVKPVVNQVECHPYLTQYRLSTFCETKGIKLSCYATLGSRGTPAEFKNPGISVLEDPVIAKTAKKAQMTPAQLLIRYQLQRKHGVVVKTSSAARLWENLMALNLHLTDTEMDVLNRLNKNRRYHSFIGMGDTHKNYPFKIPF